MTKKSTPLFGDIFSSIIDERNQQFFQHIANDTGRYGNQVIRVFKKRYPIDWSPNVHEIINDEIAFYAITFLNDGIGNGTWLKVDSSNNFGTDKLNDILFADTSQWEEYNRINTREVHPLDNWFIWHINEKPLKIGTMPDCLKESVEIGCTMRPEMIRYRMRYGYYRNQSVEYNVLKRKPLDDVDIYIRRIVDRDGSYLHFFGADAVEELVVENGQQTKLTLERPEANGRKLRTAKFWKTNWKHYEFITREEFEAAWDAE